MSAIAITDITHISDHPSSNLADQITELAAHLDAGQYQLLKLIERFDREEGWAGVGVRSCAHWLSWQCGMALGAARERVRVARALPSLPEISKAFSEGRVSFSKVRAMTRVAKPENEDLLLNVALHGTASHVEKQVRAFRRYKRIEVLEAEQGRHLQRRANLWQEDDGSFVFSARLTPEQGAMLEAALDSAATELFREQTDVPQNVSAETPSAPVDQPVPTAFQQCRADAFVRAIEAFLSGVKHGSRGDTTIHLHTDPETLKSNGNSAEGELENHGNVSAETSRRLACDAGVVHWHHDSNGQPLSIGRKSRTVPPSIKRELHRRDSGCRFPGCSCRKYVDAHHVHHWADGGETSLENLVLLCRHHHRKVHEEGFGVQMIDGQPRFTLPSGTELPASPAPRFRGNVRALRLRNLSAGLRIDRNTSVPGWKGEVMDLGLAVEGLIARE